MKITRIALIGSLALLAGLVVLKESFAQPKPAPAPAAAANTRTAVCDVVRIFANYQKAKDIEAKMSENRRSLKSEDEKQLKKIESLEATLKALNANSPDYETTLNELTDLGIKRKSWYEFQMAKEEKERYRLTEQMYKEIRATIAIIANEQGYQIVLSADETSAEANPDIYKYIERKKVLFSDQSVDITDAVMARLNETYKATTK